MYWFWWISFFYLFESQIFYGFHWIIKICLFLYSFSERTNSLKTMEIIHSTPTEKKTKRKKITKIERKHWRTLFCSVLCEKFEFCGLLYVVLLLMVSSSIRLCLSSKIYSFDAPQHREYMTSFCNLVHKTRS